MRRPDADLVLLRKYDDRAYEEAMRSGGLLRYFKGHANDRGECLSFCLWQMREQAGAAASASSHKSAADITAQTYISYTLDRYWLKKSGKEPHLPTHPKRVARTATTSQKSAKNLYS